MMSIEKAYALKDHHPNEGRVAVYHTLDERVVYLVFLKKTDWPKRAKEEVFRCKCSAFIMPKERAIHKTICSRSK